MTAETASYGSWKSPITSSIIASGSVRFDSQVVLSGEDVYWIEGRPTESGRSVLVRLSPNGERQDITAAPFSARTRVHEYGGGAFVVDGDTVYFSNFADQRIYRRRSMSEPQPITPEGELRFADGVIDRRRNRIICVCEDHGQASTQPTNSIVAVDLNPRGTIKPLASGNDFYSSPRLSPDGTRLTWLTWNHPNMPWDYTELRLGDILPDGSLGREIKIAGGSDDSICQPRFSPDGTLHFVSERTGWWNLYRWKDGRVEPLCEMEGEFGSPHWVFGISDYAFESAGRIVCTYLKDGRAHLATLNTVTRAMKEIHTPYTGIGAVQAQGGYAIFIAGSPTDPSSIVRIVLDTGNIEVLRRSTEAHVDPSYFSIPRSIEFATENNLTAHAFYYPPKNDDFSAPSGSKPPLIVISHGGPTSASTSTFNLSIQFWTSRGFAVADVNYGGSTGYGRAYRQRLDGNWGIVDVDDCVNCARHLISTGEVDPQRTAIRGGSAGGYTTLASLTFRDLFKAGASYFGVSDLEALETDTHKFESRYLDRLIGPYPERRDLFVERSPIHHVDRLSCPVVFFQGNEDKVVPPAQAELMVDALRKKGLPVAYVLFEGEQHGFRQANNIKRSLDAELYFYSRIFGFELADPIDPIDIDNL